MKKNIKNIIVTAAVILIVLTARFITDELQGEEYPALRFCGGAREVGGSCYMLEADDSTSFIVDCGAMSDAGIDILPPDPAAIDFMILTHAHSDHCGLIPELYHAGFRGQVYCAMPTDEIVPVMLRMARSFKRDRVPKDVYRRALNGITGIEFNKLMTLDNISFRLIRAEHLLGAASVEVLLHAGADTVRVLFSGDLGAGNSVLLGPPTDCPRADYVVIESTYGGRVREEDAGEGRRLFASRIGEILRGGGDVLIPAFTLGRTQEVIAVLEIFRRNGVIPPGTIFYSDSPTARKISDIYRKHRDLFTPESERERYLESTALREVRSKSSISVHGRNHRPSVFISSSGDLAHANSPRHLMNLFDSAENLLCLVGWQPPGSPGRRLQNGESPVLIRYHENGEYMKKWITPQLQVESFHCFSGHADQSKLLRYLGNIEGIRKVFLVHGDFDQSVALKNKIRSADVSIPERGERIKLDI